MKHYEKASADGSRGSSTHLGCYQDHKSDRMFRGSTFLTKNVMTPNWCIDRCRERRYTYAGVQSG